MTQAADVQLNESQLGDVRRLLDDIGKNSRLIEARALNRTAKAASSQTAKAVGAEIKLTQRTIKKFLRVRLASQALTQSRLNISGAPVPLIDFGPSQTRRGVTFRIRRTGTRERYSHAFITSLPRSGHKGVFERYKVGTNGKFKRLPIREKMGPSIPSVFQFTRGMQATVMATAADRLQSEIAGQIQRVLDSNR